MKFFAAFLFLAAGLIAFVNTSEIDILVGNTAGQDLFEPKVVNANIGDTVRIFLYFSKNQKCFEK